MAYSPEERREYARAYYLANQEKLKARTRERNKNEREAVKTFSPGLQV